VLVLLSYQLCRLDTEGAGKLVKGVGMKALIAYTLFKSPAS
jgi:hypothetical protein